MEAGVTTPWNITILSYSREPIFKFFYNMVEFSNVDLNIRSQFMVIIQNDYNIKAL